MRKNEAVISYHKKYIRQLLIGLNVKYDGDILEWLDGLENKQGYIKDLIRADIQKSRH